MKLTRIGIQNFMSVHEADVPLAGQGLVLIEGENRDDETADSNGAGKSTIFEALLWGLYGITARGLEGDEVVKHGEKKAQVVVYFDDDKGSEWVVERIASPMKLRLFQDNVDQTGPRIRETQDKLNALIGMDAPTFQATVMFGQGNVAPFSTMTDAEQKFVLERLIGLEEIEAAHTKAKEQWNQIDGRLDVATADLQQQDRRLQLLDADLMEASEKGKEWAAERQKKLARLDAEIKAAWSRTGTTDLAPLVEALRKRTAEAEECADIAGEASAASQAAYNDHRDAVKHFEDVEKRAKKMDSLEASCPLCEQQISSAYQAQHLKDLRAESKKAEASVVWKARELSRIQGDYNTLKAAAAKAEKLVQEAKDALAEAKTHNAGATAAQDTVRSLTRQRKELKEDKNVWGEREAKLEAQIKSGTKNRDSARESVDEIQRELEHAEFIVNAFSNKGLKSFILDAVVPFLDQHANHYASVLSKDALKIEFHTQTTLKTGEKRERFSVGVTNAHGADIYRGNSGGEKRKVDVAIGMALQALAAARAKANVNVSFWDEPFDALDSTAGEHAMELLREEAKQKDSVFVITHREEFKAGFSRVWRAVKSNGVTEVET